MNEQATTLRSRLIDFVNVNQSLALQTYKFAGEQCAVAEQTLVLMEKLVASQVDMPSKRPIADARALLQTGIDTYAAAIHGALTCQSNVMYTLARQAIECFGYAAKFAESEDAWRTWLRRHEVSMLRMQEARSLTDEAYEEAYYQGDRVGRRQVFSEFKLWKLQDSLRHVLRDHAHRERVIAYLFQRYEDAIDLGAHPNVLMVLGQTRDHVVSVDAEKRRFKREVLQFHLDKAQARIDLEWITQLGVPLLIVMVAMIPKQAESIAAVDEIERITDILKKLGDRRRPDA